MLLAKVITLIIALNFVSADSDSSSDEKPLIDVYEITPTDDLGEMVQEIDMVFFLVMDKSHEDNENFVQVFNKVASELIHFKFQPTQWFKVDALKYPEMEDVRESRAIHTADLVPKSKISGIPTGSYIHVIREGTVRVLEYKYNPEKDVEGNVGELRQEIMDNALEPISELNECKAIKTMCEDMDSSPYKMILF